MRYSISQVKFLPSSAQVPDLQLISASEKLARGQINPPGLTEDEPDPADSGSTVGCTQIGVGDAVGILVRVGLSVEVTVLVAVAVPVGVLVDVGNGVFVLTSKTGFVLVG